MKEQDCGDLVAAATAHCELDHRTGTVRARTRRSGVVSGVMKDPHKQHGPGWPEAGTLLLRG